MVWKCNECGRIFMEHENDENYNDCPYENCCGCLEEVKTDVTLTKLIDIHDDLIVNNPGDAIQKISGILWNAGLEYDDTTEEWTKIRIT